MGHDSLTILIKQLMPHVTSVEFESDVEFYNKGLEFYGQRSC